MREKREIISVANGAAAKADGGCISAYLSAGAGAKSSARRHLDIYELDDRLAKW
jgi:hypothetical protein